MKARNFLLLLLSFLGLGALYGGSMLVLDPSGKLIGGMPVEILEGSPFSDFLIPGIVLLVVLGILPFIVVLGLIKIPNSGFAERLNFFHDMHCRCRSLFILPLPSSFGFRLKRSF